ncbi:MAG: hypothetical protein RIE56_12755 [Amphiplicatus sp.]
MASEFAIDRANAWRRLSELDRPPWDALTSVELAEVVGASIQVLANWRLRKKGPEALPLGLYRGNRTFYLVAEVERWLRHLEGAKMSAWQVVAEWLQNRYYFPVPLETEAQTWCVAEQLRGWKIWPLKHRPRRMVPLNAMAPVK